MKDSHKTIGSGKPNGLPKNNFNHAIAPNSTVGDAGEHQGVQMSNQHLENEAHTRDGANVDTKSELNKTAENTSDELSNTSEPPNSQQDPKDQPMPKPDQAPATTTAVKEKKARKLPPELIEEHAADLASRAKAGDFPNNIIPVEQAKEHYNVSTSVFNEIFIQACLQYEMANYKLDRSPLTPPRDPNECFINERSMIMIGKSIIDGFNEKLDAENKLKKNDSYIATFSGNQIILTPKN